MKTRTIAVAVLLLAAACASQKQSDETMKVGIELEQYAAPENAYYYRGAVNVQYRITVENGTDQPITLRHVRLQTSGGGAYVLQPVDTPVRLQIGAKSTASANFSVWGTALGGQIFAHAPVSIRLTAYFDSPNGAFLRATNVNLPQEQ